MTDQLKEERILICSPFGKDAELAGTALSRAGLHCEQCPSLASLLSCLNEGVGALLTVEEALNSDWLEALQAFVANQPSWSDVPILVLTKPGDSLRWTQHAYDVLGNLTLLERPLRAPTLISAVRSALRGRRRQYEMRRADQRKDEFLAMLAHELRNPLAPISAAGELLKLKADDALKVRRASQIITRQVSHMTHLIDDLLDVARVTRNLISFARLPVDVGQVVAEAIEQTRTALGERNHQFDVQLPATPVWVKGDVHRLIQVLANLLNNAVKYTAPGGRIGLLVHVDNGVVILEVSDNGIGISAELAPHVFDLFAQAERSLDRSQGGLGLGLALVKSIVTAHGGTVQLHSDGLKQGSTFRVTLPSMQGEPGHLMPASVKTEPGSASQRILIVDDNEDAADMLCTVLTALGHDVVVAYTATAALEVAQSFKPKVSLLDIGLPDMDGTTLARRLRALPATAGSLLVAVTGYSHDEDKRKSSDAGFDAHLVKPLKVEYLQGLLANLPQVATRG